MKRRILLGILIAAAGLSLTSLAVGHETNAAKPKSGAPNVVMYTTSTCGYCAKARAWFKRRNVSWDERDIETSATANQEWRRLGGVGTPLILIDGKPIHGFDEARLDAAVAPYQ